MTADMALAWYVYAVVPQDQPPPAILTLADGADMPLAGISQDGLIAVTALMPRAQFNADGAAKKADDPAWVAGMAGAHHQVVVALHAAGPCLPLGFGTLFSGPEKLRDWLHTHAALLRGAIADLAGRAEWGLRLSVEPEAFSRFAARGNAALAALSVQIAQATPGTAFLLGKRLARAQQAAEAGGVLAVRHAIDAAAQQAGFQLRGEPAAPGRPASWSLLAPAGAAPRTWCADLTAQWASAGITLQLTGPFPPYAFARACWESANG